MTDPKDRGRSDSREERSAPLRTADRIAAIVHAPGGALLVLRAFLGVTFTYAGLQKLANPHFFSESVPGSFQEQVRGSILTSPLHHLLNPALHAPVLFAVLIALGEVAVGIGTLLGLFGKIAAFGGMALALTFFLVVSFNDSPYYYSPDIVFLFVWTPLLIGGSGTYSLDTLIGARARASADPQPESADDRAMERRIFIERATFAGAVGVATLVFSGIVVGIGRSLRHGSDSAVPSLRQPVTSTTVATNSRGTTPTGVASDAGGTKGTEIGPASVIQIGEAAEFTDPATGVPALVVQLSDRTYRGLAVCPHAGCTVGFNHSQDIFACPCHGSTFSVATGAVLGGPAPRGLSPIAVAIGPNGELYADG